ncbi:hypothetical protein EBR43_12245 [bacterium]|nr:hypothetical protein [bacterium]
MKKQKDTYIKDWEKWSDMMNALPLQIRVNCRSAGAYSIMKSGMLPEGCGISSSDINHELFDLWKSCGKDLASYITVIVELLESRERMQELLA